MKRVLVFGLVASLSHVPVASAGETLLASATRIVRDLADTQPLPPARAGRQSLNAQDSQPGIASSGLSKRTKIAIALGAAAAFAGVALSIDRRVENTTPSSLGTRQDK